MTCVRAAATRILGLTSRCTGADHVCTFCLPTPFRPPRELDVRQIVTVRVDQIYYEKAPLSDDDTYYNCAFTKIVAEGVHVSLSHFINCKFDIVDLYWCHAFKAYFVNCVFKSCDLRGNFDEASFIDCHFSGCNVGKNNLGGDTQWEKAVQINCNVNGDALPII